MDTKNTSLQQDIPTGEVIDNHGENGTDRAGNQPVVDTKSDSYIYMAPSKGTIALVMVLSFVVPVIIMALAFLKVQVYPGGKFTVLIYDMQAQFMPTIASLRYLGKSGNSFLYTFFGALGNNALLNYKSYFANPLYWLTVLFPLEQLPDVLYFITVFNIGLCGLSFCTFLLFGSQENRLKRYPYIALILSCCYALMSFNIAYSMCINWLLEVALLPMMLLGIERIIEGKKGAIYLFAMTYAVYNSDQLFFMSGIFCVLYLIYRLSEVNENRIRICVRFVICSLLALGLSMPIVMPMIYNIMEGRLQTHNIMEGKMFYYGILPVLKQMLSCRYDTIENGGLPNIFCGTFIPLIALISIIFSHKPIRTKLVICAIVLFFFISFCMVPVNQLWHGFTEPNSFPVRYSYTYCALILILAYDGVKNICRIIRTPESGMIIMECIMLLICVIELYLNAGFILSSNSISIGYKNHQEYMTRVKYTKDALENIDDDDFYRVGRDLPYSTNDGMLFGYSGIGYFSSMFERNTMNFAGMMGYSQNEHMLRDYGGTPISESIFGVKYKIIKEAECFSMYARIYKNGLYDVEYNSNALPIAFLAKSVQLSENEIGNLSEQIDKHNSFAMQEYVLSELYGERVSVYEYIPYDIKDEVSDEYTRKTSITFTATNDKPIWFYCTEKEGFDGQVVGIEGNSVEYKNKAELIVNGEERWPFIDTSSTMCICLGKFEEGEKVTVETASLVPYEDPWIVYYDESVGEKVFSGIKERGMEVYYHNNGVIKGEISATSEDDYVFITLPYMDGYSIKVDGIETEYNSYRNTLIAVKVGMGKHTMEISFCPPGLVAGIIVGIISVLIVLLYLMIPHREIYPIVAII